MTRKSDTVYLRHILDAILKVEEYTQGVDYKTFCQNTLIQDGVIRQLEIIGEATRRLSVTLKEKYAQVPWKDIAGMRDKLIHDYFGVDIDLVWRTLEQDIPPLKAEIGKALREIQSIGG